MSKLQVENARVLTHIANGVIIEGTYRIGVLTVTGETYFPEQPGVAEMQERLRTHILSVIAAVVSEDPAVSIQIKDIGNKSLTNGKLVEFPFEFSGFCGKAKLFYLPEDLETVSLRKAIKQHILETLKQSLEYHGKQ